MTDSCCLHFHYSLDLTFLFVTFPEEKKKQKLKNIKNSVSSCSVSHGFAFHKTQENKVDNVSHKNTLNLLSCPLVHFTFRFVQETKFTPHCLHSVICVSDLDKVCFSGSLIRPPKKLSKITGGKRRTP